MAGDPHSPWNCWCGVEHWTNINATADRFMLHKRIEQRIDKLAQPVLGMKGGVDRKAVLKIIEEEFAKLDEG